jgi:hypothetical protein
MQQRRDQILHVRHLSWWIVQSVHRLKTPPWVRPARSHSCGLLPASQRSSATEHCSRLIAGPRSCCWEEPESSQVIEHDVARRQPQRREAQGERAVVGGQITMTRGAWPSSRGIPDTTAPSCLHGPGTATPDRWRLRDGGHFAVPRSSPQLRRRPTELALTSRGCRPRCRDSAAQLGANVRRFGGDSRLWRC